MPTSIIETVGPWRTSRHFALEAQAKELADHDQRYRQLSRGGFQGVFTSLFLDPDQRDGIHIETLNQRVESEGAVPKGQTAVVVMLNEMPPSRLGGVEFDAQQFAVFSEGCEFQFISEPQSAVCLISLHTANIASKLPWQVPDALPRPGTSRFGTLLSPAGQHLRQLIRSGVSPDRGRGPQAGNSSRIQTLRHALEDAVVALLAAADPSARAANDWPGGGTQIFKAAREHILQHIESPLAVTALAQDLGISRRSLEYAFEKAVAMGPADYILTCRLNAIRNTLLHSGQSIGDIAAHFGVWHPSRFAMHYRRLFGELPSETKAGLAAGGKPNARRTAAGAEAAVLAPRTDGIDAGPPAQAIGGD